MPQHDYEIANAPGAAVRSDLNAVLQAIATLNSGPTPPVTTFAHMLWFDENEGVLKQRNATNTGWEVRYNLPPSPFHNRVINGDMRVAQRGTSFPAAASNSFVVDRFQIGHAQGTAVLKAEQVADHPILGSGGYCAGIEITTADMGAVNAAGYGAIVHKIEGSLVADMLKLGSKATLAFQVYAGKSGVYGLSLRNGEATRSLVLEIEVDQANTWERKIFPIDFAGAISSGVWNFDNGNGLTIVWSYTAGSNFLTTPGTWQNGNLLSTTNQVNLRDTVGAKFRLTDVMLVPGTVAPDFLPRPQAVETLLCQRYYEVGVDQVFSGDVTSGSTYFCPFEFRATKRATPTVTATHTGTPSGFNTSNPTVSTPNVNGCRVFKVATSTVGGGNYAFNWVADAEM